MRELTLRVDPESGDSVYEQIARQIRSRIASGDLAPGFALPPVRTLASDLGVSLNTVARAYRVLGEEGFVRIRHRSGAEVAAPAEIASRPARDRLREELRTVVARMKQAGIPADDIREVAEIEIGAPGGPDGGREGPR